MTTPFNIQRQPFEGSAHMNPSVKKKLICGTGAAWIKRLSWLVNFNFSNCIFSPRAETHLLLWQTTALAIKPMASPLIHYNGCLHNLIPINVILFLLVPLHIKQLVIGSDATGWTHFVKYLGVHIVSGMKLSFDINPIKPAFFTACNSVCSQSQCMDEILQLSLIETYCLPILTYAAPAVSLKARQLQELNSCWNSAYRRVFGFHQWESVRSFMYGLGRLDLKHVQSDKGLFVELMLPA